MWHYRMLSLCITAYADRDYNGYNGTGKCRIGPAVMCTHARTQWKQYSKIPFANLCLVCYNMYKLAITLTYNYSVYIMQKILYITSAARIKYINALTRQLRTQAKNSKSYLATNDAINKFYKEELEAADAVARGELVEL